MKEIIPIACDHAGYELKLKVIEHLKSKGFDVQDCGNGVQMTVNKDPHVRCALCWTPEIAHLGRQHNDCNCISIPARFISEETALQIVDEYLNTEFEGGRHQRRVEKISQLL